jgi:hypothetical protein
LADIGCNHKLESAAARRNQKCCAESATVNTENRFHITLPVHDVFREGARKKGVRWYSVSLSVALKAAV